MRNPALTEQQQRAVLTRDVSVILSSGAGCGKTHVLIERYLSHLRHDQAEVGQIVAITFTDRAARQMRGRIRAALVGHLREAQSDDEAEVWARHLRNLESAPISTIHSFAGSLLRQHAVAAGLDPRFEVLEEVLSTNLESEALHRSLQKLLTARSAVAEDLRQLILLFGWRAVAEAVQSLIQGRDERSWQVWQERPRGQIVEDWQQYARVQFLPRYLAFLLEARPALVRCRNLLERHPPQPGPMTEPVALLLRELPRLAEAPDLGRAVHNLAEAAKVGKVGKKAWPEPAVYEAIKQAFEAFRSEIRSLGLEAFHTSPESLGAAVEVGQRFLRVAREVVRDYTEHKKLYSVVDFQDLLVLARDLLHEHPEVRTRLQERYRFLLIDELQDTDPVQMALIESLCGGGMTEGKLFAVGDHKQSIYRFRGADVHLFQKLRRSVAHEGRQGLTVNFRSQPGILTFANALLGQALQDYEPLEGFHPRAHPHPCVEFLWAPRRESSRTAPVSVTQARTSEAEWIARRIASLIDREHLVRERSADEQGRLRPVRAGDVVLLFRAMSNVHLYEAALRQQGLHYYLVGGRAFFAQQEIYDILNLLRALENPQDGVSLAGTLRSPFCCLSDESLLVLASHPEGLWAGLLDEEREEHLPPGQRGPVVRARRHLCHWRGLKDRLPIARLLGQVLGDSGYDAAVRLEFLGDRKLANLWKLMELARTFDRSGLFGLAEFIDRLRDLVRTQPREEQAATQPENADVVRLMTIHQAKGLEFPVVIIPDVVGMAGSPYRPVVAWDPLLGCVARPPTEEDEPPFPDFAWKLHEARNRLEEWHEDLRTLYVACTRAQDYLILSGALSDSQRTSGTGSGHGPWMLTLSERFNLSTGECLAGDVPEERRPQVRVHHAERPFPSEPASSAMAPSQPESSATDRPNSVADASGSDEGPALMRPAATGPSLVEIAELEEWLAGGAREVLPRALRVVLRDWDFRDPEGWRRVLARTVLAEGQEKALLEGMLTQFACSPARARLAGAVVLEREMEFLLRPGDKRRKLPALAGTIDCLWQDEAGNWHVLFYATPASPPEGPGALWRSRRASLLLAGQAVRQQMGNWPATLTVHALATGLSEERPGRQGSAYAHLLRDLERFASE